MSTRALITGLGIVAPTGVGTETYWHATLNGKSGIDRIRAFDASAYSTTLAGNVDSFAAAEYVPGRLIVQTDRWTQLGLAAAAMALRDAGVDPKALPEYGLGVITAASSGGNEFGQREIEQLWTRGPGAVGVYQSIAWFYAASTGQISIHERAKGRCGVIVAEQAGGLDVLGHSRRVLREDGGVLISGGTEAPLSPYALVCQTRSGRLSTAGNPEECYLPFDRRAAGFVPGEGGAMLIVESAESARERGARTPYGEIAGYAATFDPRPGSGRPPALCRAITLALADARLGPEDVDVVFADAAADPELDRIEADALASVFGPHGVPVTAPKTMTGRLYAGGAALDAATALLSMRDSVIPPTVGTARPDPAYGLDLVCGTPRQARVRTALVLARGAGGFNAALVLTAP
ncbi:ketosynthase chain-length factor [Nonomuraea zeae]|uniref:Ketosynthase chain-length factor n=1 Tax=Nonomuraea zeae TaxID=1642303 RepID=A0A5S4GVC5_9ACTN|nr:ketosynthase chain-length factor [Nonomuraea zeae]TMR36719.1 ketosynthase chain-length factor [Nonomuraea zeae]